MKTKFNCIFEGSEFDEKMDGAKLDMEGTGSNFICCLCRCERIEAQTKLGTWSITSTFDEIIECGKICLKNPNNLSKVALKEAAIGVTGLPFVLEIEAAFDSTVFIPTGTRFEPLYLTVTEDNTASSAAGSWI